MTIQPRSSHWLFHVGGTVLFLAVAFIIDRASAEPTVQFRQIVPLLPNWLALTLLTAMFALALVLYIRSLLVVRPPRPAVTAVLLLVSLIVLSYYPLLRSIFPFLSPRSLSPFPLLAQVDMALSDAGPRSYSTIATLVVIVGLLLSHLWARRHGGFEDAQAG